MTEAYATETVEPNVQFPVATSRHNIKTEVKEIKSIRLRNDVCGLYIDKK